MSGDVPALVDHLFRRNAARITATLTRVLGADRLDLAEDVVQEAMVKALAQWPFGGTPDDPAAWLFRVARNKAIDRLRRDTNFRDKERAIVDAFSAREETGGRFSHELEDDDLQMMLMCCDPQLPPETRLALTLKCVCSFGVDEIASALLTKPEAIAQRLVRAKRFLRDNAIELELPSREELPRRLDSLLDVVYLMFNEGYTATAGDDLVRRDLVDEAIRLAEELAEHEATSLPKTHALAALMHRGAGRRNRARLMLSAEFVNALEFLETAGIFRERSIPDMDSIVIPLVLYRTECQLDAHLTRTPLPPDCGFDGKFGFDCSDKQKETASKFNAERPPQAKAY